MRATLKIWELNDGFTIEKTKYDNREKYDYVIRKDGKRRNELNMIFESFDEAVIGYIVVKYGRALSTSETLNLIELVSDMFQVKKRIIAYERNNNHE